MWRDAIPDLNTTPTPDLDTTPDASVNSLTSAIIFTKGQATTLRIPEAFTAMRADGAFFSHGRRHFLTLQFGHVEVMDAPNHF